jgi:hypothetical protein
MHILYQIILTQFLSYKKTRLMSVVRDNDPDHKPISQNKDHVLVRTII